MKKKQIDNQDNTKEIDLAKKYQSSIPGWVWIGASVFLLLIWILGISIEQSNYGEEYVKEPKMLLLSYFNYNLVLSAIFISLLGSFIVTIIFILRKVFFIVNLFFSFLFLLLVAPFIIPFFIQTSLHFSPFFTYKHNLIQENKKHEDHSQHILNIKEKMIENAQNAEKEQPKPHINSISVEIKLEPSTLTK